jgi:CHAT domain-containing protein
LVWQQALGIIDHDQDYLLRAMAHSTMARAALTASMPELAAKELAESAELFARAPQTRATLNDKVEAQTQLARVEALLGRPDEALSLLKGLQAYLRTLSNNYVAIKFYSTLGEVYLKRGEDAEADTALKSAVALSELGARSLQSERDRLTWTEATAGSYRGLVELKIRQGNVHDALETWEWSRAVTLRTGNRGAQEGVAYAAWSSAPLSSQMLADGPALPEPNEVARLLPTLIHETIISYGLFPDGISIWLYDNRGVVHRWVPKASSEILGIVNRFRDLCADRTSDIGEVQREARRLYALLIEPVENSIALDRTLEIEADEQLRGIPMEALLDSQNRYLSDRVTVMNSVGIYYRSYLRPSITISAQSPVLITAVSGAGVSANLGLPLLPDALKEGEQIAQRFFAAHLLEESQATTKALYNELPSAQVFHFAGHGVPSPDGTQLAFFDKPLSASSLPVSGLQRLQLAVLSACNTQRDFTAESVDSEGFIRKFVRAKVPYVVASRWAVDSAMSTRFMEIFYQNLLSGHTPAESIGLAQQSLHFNNRFGHPYYWAAFSTYGAFN